jgi:oligopeptide/dipeptide ABC transporter ATP-binding protein
MTALLDVRDLRTEFTTDDGVVRAVDGVSFSLEAGKTLGIVGESGSGKSVTSLSILKLLGDNGRIAGGSIRFDGVDLVTLPEDKMRAIRGNRIAMIFQDPMTSLNPYLTVGTQLVEVLVAHRGLTRGAARERAIQALARTGLPDPGQRLGNYPHQLSGGQRQRVMIAMALACEPALLIADEPTTALDVTIQAQILELIRALQRDHGTAVILITHDLGVVAGTADDVAVMYAGKIVESASARELFARPSHPYTKGLLGSIPRMDRPRQARLTAIPGLPPDLAHIPSGCPFHPRCAEAVEACKAAYPAAVPVTPAHSAACIHVVPGGPR